MPKSVRGMRRLRPAMRTSTAATLVDVITVPLTVSPPCTTGSLICTARIWGGASAGRMSGVGNGVGSGEIEGETEGDGDGEGVGVAKGVGVTNGVGVGAGVTDGNGTGVGKGTGVAVATGVGDATGEGVDDGAGAGAGLGVWATSAARSVAAVKIGFSTSILTNRNRHRAADGIAARVSRDDFDAVGAVQEKGQMRHPV